MDAFSVSNDADCGGEFGSGLAYAFDGGVCSASIVSLVVENQSLLIVKADL